MKLRRFNDDGIARVRQVLPEIEKTGNLDVSALIADEKLTIAIPELDSVDLDPDRTFPTTFAFCEYFHSLMKDHHPLNYRTDVGFWTWLAMVYLKQLVKIDDEGVVDVGQDGRIIFNASYNRSYRHLLSASFYVYEVYRQEPQICNAITEHALNRQSEFADQVLTRQSLVQNPCFMRTISTLYFDETLKKMKTGAGGKGAGSIRRFIDVVDQIGLTRDFFTTEDSGELLRLLPNEFAQYRSGR